LSKRGFVFIGVLLTISIFLFPATYKGKKIDEKHFSAKIQMKGATNVYNVDVVFIGNKANLAFALYQVLPIEAGNSTFMTLYLLKEEIKDPKKILLKQVSPPVIMNDKDPEEWEATAYWFMELDLKQKKKKKSKDDG
jgi:hypothetical protein